MRVNVVTLELRALLDRLLTTHDYEACVLGLGGGDADPNSEMNVWLSSGGTHLWNPGQTQPATPWEAEIDTLMRRQLTTRDVALAKRLYDRVQELVAQNLPIISLVSPSVLVGATKGLGQLPADGSRPSRALERRGVVLARGGVRWRRNEPGRRRRRRAPVLGPDVTWSDARLVRACLNGNERRLVGADRRSTRT